MTIVVTGAGGFVGRTLVDALLKAGERVTALDAYAAGLAPHPNLLVITGDLGSADIRKAALNQPVHALVHLATVPGGAAEANPAESRRININAMYDLLEECGAGGRRPRVVYASSIAVFGDPLPSEGVDDLTPLSPRLVYGGHKAMMEIAVAMLSNRGAIDGVSIRLPGILARPKGPSGMKSAFMSDLFHALRSGEEFVCPVTSGATIWAQSVTTCVANIRNALALDTARLPVSRAVTLPALRVTMGDLAAEIAAQCRVSPDLVSYTSDPGLEAAFGAHPSLATPAAERAGFRADASLAGLVGEALEHIASN